MRSALTSFLILGIVVTLLIAVADADNFAAAYYDSSTDELVVTMLYRGTNPHHTFSLKWGPCMRENRGYGVPAQVLDSQWHDAALKSFRKTVRFKLTALRCRPAAVTLRTAPRFYFTILVPMAPP